MLGSKKLIKIESRDSKPSDTIEALEFLKEDTFVSASWAGMIRLYQITKNEIIMLKNPIKIGIPIFKILYLGGTDLLAGCGDGSLIAVDLENGKTKALDEYKSPIVGLFETEYDRQKLIIVVESKGKVHIFQLRDQSNSKTVDFETQIIDCDHKNGLFGFIFPKSKYYFSDFRDLVSSTRSFDLIESNLKTELKFIRIDPRGESLIIIDQVGRGNFCKIESVRNKKLESKILFPTLKTKIRNREYYSSPTAVAYCQIGPRESSQCILVANDAKNLTIWNCIKKHQGLNFKEEDFDEAVTAAAFNSNCTAFVFSTGYCWNCGVSGIKDIKSGPELYCRIVQSDDFYNLNG